MPRQYEDFANDLYATLGLDIGASFDYSSDLYKRAIGTRYTPFKRNALWTEDKTLFYDAAPGLRSAANLNAAKMYDVRRRQQSSELYDKMVEQSNQFKFEVDQLMQATSLENRQFQEMQATLDATKASAISNATTSSVGAYSVAAKRQMQETQRMLAMLSGTKAPEQADIDTTFINPLTGERVGQDFEFVMDAYDAKTHVADMLRSDYQTKTRANLARIDDALKTNYGRSYDEWYNPEFQAKLETATSFYDSLTPLEQLRYSDGVNKYAQLGDSGFTFETLQRLKNQSPIYDNVYRFAESRALAELTDVTEGYTSQRIEGRGYANVFLTGSQLYMEADRDEILNQLISDTATRFDTAALNERTTLEQEFQRRKQTAASMAADAVRRNELNAARAQDIEQQKIQYEQLLNQQQQEYASTLASVGAVETSDGSGVTFKEIRPV